jgi:hypothetical protein
MAAVAVEIFLLWVLCNTLFLVPGPYKGERGVIIIVTALLAAVVAWGSGRMFGPKNTPSSLGKTLSTPPAVICIFVLAVTAVVMVVAVVANRWAAYLYDADEFIYDGAPHLCICLQAHRQRTRFGIRTGLLRSQVLRPQHGTLHVARLERTELPAILDYKTNEEKTRSHSLRAAALRELEQPSAALSN